MKGGASGMLLLLVGLFLLMLAISGKFHDIFTAAFPSLGGKTVSGSQSPSSGSNQQTPGQASPASPPIAGPDPGQLYTKDVYQSGGMLLAPLQGGGYQYSSLLGGA
jgi:hypothetical protein